jgi:hypothetical protein
MMGEKSGASLRLVDGRNSSRAKAVDHRRLRTFYVPDH